MRGPEDYDPWFRDEPVALEVCNRDGGCPIRQECLIFALTNNLKDGVFGGRTESQRRWIRKKWPLRKGKEPRPEWKDAEVPSSEQCKKELEADPADDCD